jgi:signal transduction histidine kinase
LGIKVERDIQSGDVSLLVDKNQIVQVLVNVMQNSCEALAERLEQGLKHPPPHIGITAHTVMGNDSLLQIEISDNGLGIREPDLSRVSNPFFTTKEKTKNAGLGLSVSYQIIAEHGGEMEISSVEGQSTTVVIRLPIAQGR